MNRRHTLLLVILLALASAGFWLWETKPWNPPTTPIKQKDPLRIFTMLLPQVSIIEIENHETGQVARVQRGKNQTWWLAKPEQKQLDTDKMISMVMSLTSLSAERVLTDTVALESFGLNEPTLSLHIIGTESSQVLDIGCATPIGGAFYAQRRKLPEIYLVGAKMLNELRQLVDWLPSAVPEEDEDIADALSNSYPQNWQVLACPALPFAHLGHFLRRPCFTARSSSSGPFGAEISTNISPTGPKTVPSISPNQPDLPFL